MRNLPKYFIPFLTLFLLIGILLSAQNQAPAVTLQSVVAATPGNGVGTLELNFSVTDTENDTVSLCFAVSGDGGNTFLLPIDSMTGDTGTGLTTPLAAGQTTLFYSLSDWANLTGGGSRPIIVRVLANDNHAPTIQEMVDAVDSSAVWNNLLFIEGIRHRVANPTHLDEVRDSLQERFARAGLQATSLPFPFAGFTGENIQGRQPGLKSEAKSWYHSGHYDSVNNSPGADDNGTAVAVMLEVMRVLSVYSFENSLNFIGFDLEEAGLVGSDYYVSNDIPAWESVQGVVNLEMVGFRTEDVNTQNLPFGFDILFPDVADSVAADSNRGNFILNVANTNSAQLRAAFDAGATYAPEVRELSLAVSGNGQVAPDLRRSDHASFWDAGFQALMITDGADTRYPYYHTPSDTSGNLDPAFMAGVTKMAVATLAELARPMHPGDDTAHINLNLPASTANTPDLTSLEVFPNPSAHTVHIKFELPEPGSVTLKVLDLQGKLVWERAIENCPAGPQHFRWVDHEVPAGSYFLQVNTGTHTHTQKILRTR